MIDPAAAPEPVLSALDAEWFQPPRSPRRYRIAPLSYRQRGAMQRDIRRTAGPELDRAVMLDVLRQAVRELAPANLDDCLAAIDTAEADPDDRAIQARVAVIEHAVAGVSAYDAMQESLRAHNEARVFAAARHTLRGWDGPGLPPFHRIDGLVPDDLLDALPAAELQAIATRATTLAWLGTSAEGNSAAPSPSPASPAPTQEG
jgi:hypothetical protein